MSETAAADQLATVHPQCMMRLQRPPACRRSRKSSATVVAHSSVTLRDYIKMSRRTRPSTATSTCPLVDHPTTSGNVVRADQERDGSITSGRTMESPGGSVEACDESWSPRSNATALAGFALTTTTSVDRALASLDRHAQLTRCFSTLTELVVCPMCQAAKADYHSLIHCSPLLDWRRVVSPSRYRDRWPIVVMSKQHLQQA